MFWVVMLATPRLRQEPNTETPVSWNRLLVTLDGAGDDDRVEVGAGLQSVHPGNVVTEQHVIETADEHRGRSHAGIRPASPSWQMLFVKITVPLEGVRTEVRPATF